MALSCLESWARDPFDRTIVAQARLDSCPWLSRDRKRELLSGLLVGRVDSLKRPSSAGGDLQT
jgi:hypothetical protein